MTFLDIDIGAGLLNLDYNNDDSPISYCIQSYIGYRKVLWWKHVALEPFVRGGTNLFYIDESNDDYFQMLSPTIKLGFGVSKMIRPFINLKGTIFSTITLGNPQVKYEIEDSSGEFNATHSRLNWYGMQFSLSWMK